jgi:hypothetical protein
MQHLDEGTIHSWLDGALSAEEAARVSAHVEECPQCAAAVAEARGFIAASSRILTSLDNVPKGVVPVGERVKPRNWAAWRAAAAVLVVALGSFAVLRERMTTRPGAAEVAPLRVQTTEAGGIADRALTDSVQPEALPPSQAPRAFKVLAKPATPTRAASPLVAAPGRDQEPARQDNASPMAVAPQPSSIAVADVRGAARGKNPAPQSAGGVTGSVQALSAGANSVVLSGRPSSAGVNEASALTSIRIVGLSLAHGEERILYEVAPGDTVVVLGEALAMMNWAATGAGTTTTTQSADTSGAPRIRLRGAQTMSTVPDSQNKKASFSAPSAPSRPPSAETLNGVTTLTWIDPGSGNMMRLSGRHSAAELLEIKGRIEKLRAAETAAKKKP